MTFAAYIGMALSLLSLFIHRTWWLWLPLLAASMVCAYLSDIITPWALLSVGLMWGSYFALSSPVKGWQRGFTAIMAVLISALLLFHVMPGFANRVLIPGLKVFNYDKPFAGFFILVYLVKIASTKKTFFRAYVRSIPFIVGGIGVLIGLAYILGHVQFAPTLPPDFGWWVFRTLFFVCIPEEAFFRGFIQMEIYRAMQKSRWSAFVAIVLAALTFTAVHMQMALNIPYLIMVFAAGMIYGLVYHLTRSIESAILIHFFVNVLNKTVFL